MAIPTTEDDDRTSKFVSVLKNAASPIAGMPLGRRKAVPRWLVIGAVVVGVLGLGVAATVKSDLLVPAATGHQILTETAHRADLVVSVTEDGNVESSHNVDIKCEVKGGSTILWIVKDGTEVTKGDELVRLDSAVIEDQINQQKITYEKARATMIDADKVFESAKIGVEEYKEGTFLQTLQTLQANATVAKENLESAKNSLQHTIRMHRKGYVNDLQRDAQAFAVERSKLDLNVAETAQSVLEKFTRRKMLTGLESARDSAEAKKASEKAAFELEEVRLQRFQTQLEKCTIVAPDDGMVVYANDQLQTGRGGGGNQQSIVEEGALMRERQSIIRLPDLSRMQVKCTVHESKVDSLQRGMLARIRIQDREFQGTVTSVANQAEPSTWFSGTVKEYATIVSIDSDPHGLRPGMTAAVEILIANLKDVLSVQVQAVVEKGGKFYCWVNAPSGPQKRPVLLGMSNNTRIEIKDGLQVGDEVLLNPRAAVEEAREEVKTEQAVDVKKRFGGDKPVVLPKAGAATPHAAAPPAGGAGRAAAGAGAPGGGGGSGGNLMSFDKDGDKKISKDEAPEGMKPYFDMIDKNSDGFIDAAEAAEARRMRQAAGAGGAGGPGGGP